MSDVFEGSKRLDKTLALEAFAYKDRVSLIVKNHLLKSPRIDADSNDQSLGGQHVDEVAEYWSSKIWTFLDDLRSAGEKHTGKLVATDEISGSPREWKLKDESICSRVMYREGPVGTPFHTLCLDGTVNGDFTSAFCVAWEAPMYKEWWPQFTVPSFKITESKWLRKIRVGEDLSLIRFKVPWPLAPREVVISAFELEYLEEDLIIGLLDTVSEGVEIDEKLRGFSANDLPASSSAVRMDVSGGFVMQRTSKDQFFFRTIATVDMKLDFVPSWLINFISRQVAGQGLKLYQKAVLAASSGTGSGKQFQKNLKTGMLYNRMRAGFEAKTAATSDPLTSQPIEWLPAFKDSLKVKSLQGRMGSFENNQVVPYPFRVDEIRDGLVESSISSAVKPVQSQPEPQLQTHVGVPDEVNLDDEGSSKHVHSSSTMSKKNNEVREYDDPEFEWAVNILDKMILFTRSCAAGPAAGPECLQPTQTLDHVQSESTSSGGTQSLDSHLEGASSCAAGPTAGPECLQSTQTLDHVQSESTSSGGTQSLDSQLEGASFYSTGKSSSLPAVTSQVSDVALGKSVSTVTAPQVLDNEGPSKSPGWQLPGRDAESSGTSGFLSASEIEIVSSQDDTDCDVGASGSMSGQPSVEPVEVKPRRRKWHWTCFSPRHARKSVGHGRKSFFANDSGRASDAHWRSLMGDSTRFIKGREHHTAGDEMTASRPRLDSSGHLRDRFVTVTLGELLINDEW